VAVSAAGLMSLGSVVIAEAARRGHGKATHRVHGAAARQQVFRALLRAQARRLAKRAHASSISSTPDSDLAFEAAQYGYERSAPAFSVSGQALVSAAHQAAGLAGTGGAWQDLTTLPYNAEPANYTDPFWSNVGAGFSLVGGRTTALAQTPDGAWFAGTADGGVWRSSDRGGTWQPIFDSMPSLSIGALAVDPADGSLWVGTGEANTSQDSYAGTGVYRSKDGGSSFALVGANADGTSPIVSRTIYKLAFDDRGNAYAATDNGLFRFAANTGRWTEVLSPAGPGANPPYANHVSSVAVVPGSSGQDVIAAVGWRGPGDTQFNGFYESTDDGQTFAPVKLSGDINASDIGRTTFAYSADGKKLYAVVESPSALGAGKESVLQGVFVSSGSPASVAGPWAKIGDEAKLAASGSALAVGSGYGVGVQAWYNQDLAVDPTNDNHVYVGLEEVFESTNGGTSWVTASPYWNYGLACNEAPSGCPKTTHPDQHAMMIANNQIVIGNDGGVYSRPLSDVQQYGDWQNLNATLESWQYYDARAGQSSSGHLGVWGGLQDNGTSVLYSGRGEMLEPAGGDGFDVIVDPANPDRMLGEYADGAMYSSTDGGHSFNSFVSPGCVGQATVGLTPLEGCDPSMRFLTPLVPDQQTTNTWVTGGRYVWVSQAGWGTTCKADGCSWRNVFDTGENNAVTALSSANRGKVIYAAWVAAGGNPGPSFASGIATNYGGTWHQVSTAGLPNRYIAGVTVDPSNPAHAYAVFNGYSRRWIPGGGLGHVFETVDGGRSWQNISTNLPDVASDALVEVNGQLALATDLGMYTAPAGRGSHTAWSRLGTGLPNASVNDVTVGPQNYLYAATHGRGIWRLRMK
jgi:sugar lactone lactonase YvrE